MDNIKDFTDLKAWQLAHRVRLEVYEFIKLLPPEEKYNRIDQLRRSSSLMASNIAEGFGRYHYQENIQFCRQARGSLEETRDNIIAARDLKQIPQEKCEELLELLLETRKVLNGYIRFLQKQKTNNSS